MAESVSSPAGERVGGTIVACLIAPIVLIVVAGLAGFGWFVLNNIMTVIRPSVIVFMAAMIGGYTGSYCARAACDTVLKSYSGKVVFVEVSVLLMFAIIFETTLPFSWERIAPISQAILMIVLSWGLFWKGEAI